MERMFSICLSTIYLINFSAGKTGDKQRFSFTWEYKGFAPLSPKTLEATIGYLDIVNSCGIFQQRQILYK